MAAGSGTFTGSVYVKGTGSSFTFRLKIYNDSGTEQSAISSYTLNSSTTSWQRVSVTKTFSSAEGNVRLAIIGSTACGNYTAYIWGAQVEQQSTPGVYANSGANTVTAGNGLVADGTLFFSNVATDITTGTNENLTITPGGTGNVILTSGNVGIGTTSPSYKLDVNGDIRIASGSELYSYGSATLGNRTYTQDNYVTDGQTFTASIDALDIALGEVAGGSSGLWRLTGSNLYPASTDYNVGIGTTSPNQKLSVAGTLGILEGGVISTILHHISGWRSDSKYYLHSTNLNRQ